MQKLADISFFTNLSETTSSLDAVKKGSVVHVNNVDVSLRNLVLLENNKELSALYDKLVKYGTADKADAMLRGFRPRDLGELINLIRLGLSAPQHKKSSGSEEQDASRETMIKQHYSTIDDWERSGTDLAAQLNLVKQDMEQLGKKRRFGLFGWLPGRSKKRRAADAAYKDKEDLARLIQERLAEQKYRQILK